MQSFTFYLAYAILFTAPSTLGRATLPSPFGISVHQNIAVRPTAPALQLQKLYKRFNTDLPTDLSLAINNTKVVASPGAYDARYLCPITIGQRTFNLDLDSGSSDLWVFSTDMSDSTASGHTLYDPATSGTAEPSEGSTWEITYADGSSANGNVYTDIVSIDNVTVTSQAIEAAQTVSSQYSSDEDLDGILGLAFSSINSVRPTSQSTFLDNAFQQGAISRNLFTVDLQKGGPGSIDFGYVDPTKYAGQLSYVSVDNSSGFWNVSGSGYQVGSGTFSYEPFSAILDTGTSLMVMDASLVESYWSSVNGASYDASQAAYSFPCETDLPDLQITLGSYVATVPGNFMNFAPIDGLSCYGGLQNNTNLGLSILGAVFLKSQFVVFDAENLQAGFAAKPWNNTGDSTTTEHFLQATTTNITSSAAFPIWSSSVTYDDGLWHTTYTTQDSAPTATIFTDNDPSITSTISSYISSTLAEATVTQPYENSSTSSAFALSKASANFQNSNTTTASGSGELTITITTTYSTPGPVTLTLPTLTYVATQFPNVSTAHSMFDNSSSLSTPTIIDSPTSPVTVTLLKESVSTPVTTRGVYVPYPTSSNATTTAWNPGTTQTTNSTDEMLSTTFRTVTLSSTTNAVVKISSTASSSPIPTIPVFEPPYPYNLIPIYANSTTENGTIAIVRRKLRPHFLKTPSGSSIG